MHEDDLCIAETQSDDGETVEAMRLLVKRDKFEFNLNLTHKEKEYMYCELILL
jgi:hypothetical protein